MVLTRAALAKKSKNDLISIFTENNKLNNSVIELANQLANVSETLKRMESQQKQQMTPCIKDW